MLILSHLVYALRERIAQASDCDSFEVSVPLLGDLLPRLCSPSALQLEPLVQSGRKHGLLRASLRLVLIVPQVELSCYQLSPPNLPRQRPGVPQRLRGRGRLSRPRARVADLGAAAEAPSVQAGQGHQSGPNQSCSAAQSPTEVT